MRALAIGGRRAYFVDNLNLAKIGNLLAIAEGAGLPAAEAERVLVERQFRESIAAGWQRSRELGVDLVMEC